MSEGQLFRQPPAAMCPPPPPSQPVRFDGEAYVPTKTRKARAWVWREPTGQKDLIAAKKKRRSPKKEAPEEPKPKLVRDPDVHAYDDAYFEEVRKEEAERLRGEPQPVEPPTGSNARQASIVQGTWSTPDQWIRAAKKGRKASLKSDGRRPMKASTTRAKPIPSGRVAAKTTGKRAAAKKKESRKALVSVEVTDALLVATATSALDRFKTNRVANARRVLISLLDVLSSEDGRGEQGLIAHMVRRTRVAAALGLTEEKAVDRRFLHSAATRALGELIKLAWNMLGSARDATDDPRIRRRVGATGKRSRSAADEFKIRLYETRDGREVLFLLTIERSGRITLQGVVSSKR